MNYGFAIDNRKCIGCHACTVACKAEHDVPIGVNRTWVKYVERGTYPDASRFFSVMRCNHCEDAPCVEICPVTALFTRDDGIVDFDSRRCIGCKSCTQACPYDAIYIDPEQHTAAKCNYCAHRVDIGLEPACVNVCPEQAIVSGDLDDPGSELAKLIGRQQVQVRKAEKGTRPNLFYINGDEASLNPAATAVLEETMQTDRPMGVGHFAKYAEKRLHAADSEQLKKQLTAETGVASSASEDTKFEADRRIYDAPSKGVLWGWEVSAYVWTKAIAAGSFSVAFVMVLLGIEVVEILTPAALISLGFLGLTGMLLIKDLDKPLRFAYVLLRPQWRSWLVRGGFAITLFGACLSLWLVGMLAQNGVLKVIGGWGSLLVGLVVGVYTAFLFGQAKGRDFWQSPLLAVHMLLHTIMAGCASITLLAWVTGEYEVGPLYLTMTIALAVNLLTMLCELFSPHPTVDAKRTVSLIVRGPFAVFFWGGAVLVGCVVPLVMLLMGESHWMVLASVLVLIGIYVTEHIWVKAPQMIALS